MTEQDARQEAEKQAAWRSYIAEHGYSTMPTSPDTGADFSAGFERGWQASRVVVAAPSDTDREAAIEAVAQVMFEPPSLGQDDPEYTWAQMVVEDPTRADMYREDAAAALEAARFALAQPVQVEVTEGTDREALAKALRAADEPELGYERKYPDGGIPDALSDAESWRYYLPMADRLVAALGGERNV